LLLLNFLSLCVEKQKQYPFVQDIFFSRFADFLLFYSVFCVYPVVTSHHRRTRKEWKTCQNWQKRRSKSNQIQQKMKRKTFCFLFFIVLFNFLLFLNFSINFSCFIVD
jgi:hypothetical protein